MDAKSIIKEFHQKRRLLNNLRENMATPRLKGMWNFLNSKAELVSIIYNVPTIEHLVAKAGPNKPIEAATYDEIVGVGLYIMRKCSESNDHVNLIINHLGLGLKSTQKNENQIYVNELMEGFIDPALDYVEEKLNKPAIAFKAKKTQKEKAQKQEGTFGKNKNDEENLQNAFIEFLKKKGYPLESMLPANKGGAPNLSIIEPGSKKPIVLIEFKLSNEHLVLGRLALDFIHYKQTQKLSNCLAYIVCPSLDKSSEPFEIIEIIDNGYESLLSINDFPTYEDLIEEMETKPEASEDEDGGGGKLKGSVSENVKVGDDVTLEIIGESKSEGMSVAEHGWGDRIADKDNLGFRPYVEVVARFLTHEETELPLTLSVEGEWGSGKSSFLLQLKNEIGRIYKDKGEEKAFIVEFDPWRHDKDEALWAAFALTFLEQVRGGFFELKRWVGDRHLFFMRYQWKDGWIDMVRFFTFWLAFIVLCVLLGLLTIRRGPEWVSYLCDNVLLVAEEVNTEAGEDSSGGVNGRGVIKWILGGGGLAAVAGGLASVLGLVRRITGNPLKVNLKKYIKHPQYADRVSFIERFHNDFKKIVSAYSGEERVYVFIDDLDRCEVPKAAELMESINLMISENPRLVFVMGMDREKVAAGLAVKHEKLLPYLSEPMKKKDADKDEDEAKRRRGVRYGYSFIEKFIQVPFRLPQPDEKCINEMLMGMSGQLKEKKAFSKKAGAKAEEQPHSELSGEVPETKKDKMKQAKMEEDKKLEAQRRAETKDKIDKVFTKFDGDDHNFRAIVLMVSKAFDFNPRRAKQFVNIFRLRAATAKVTGLYEPKEDKRLTFEQLGKFVGIGLGWPLLIRDIERRPALLEELVGEAEGRTEGEANEKKNPKKNGKRFEKWADDEKLMELLKAGCENEKDAEKCRRFSLKGLDVKKLLQVAPRVMSDEEEMV